MTFTEAALNALSSLPPYLSGLLLHDLPGNIIAQLICTAGAALITSFRSRSTTPPATPQLPSGGTHSPEPDTPSTSHDTDPDDRPPCSCTDTPPTT
ncbi:hypothetical protein ACFCXC_35485 [Streptomyces microflavus]|uniref:hypothetical protein n=1 Tax=Streptomyces microflavus TaxID=1919 RepID=UPI0035E1395E